MSDRREKRESSGKSGSSKGSSKSSSVKTGGKKAQKDDWSGVNEPDERRRIQNRLAQRKFRMFPVLTSNLSFYHHLCGQD